MIKANELRIGNWVLNNDEDLIQVSAILKTQSYENLNPIPLTPEILEKAGFEEIGMGFFGGKKYVFDQFIFDFAGSHLDLSECIEGNYVNRKNIKYVHQLQNLYFALTGEELTVNFKDLTYQ